VLLGSRPDRRFAQIDGGREFRNVAGVRDLKPIQSLRRVGDFICDMEVLVEKPD
jgi:hypothetical protein